VPGRLYELLLCDLEELLNRGCPNHDLILAADTVIQTGPRSARVYFEITAPNAFNAARSAVVADDGIKTRRIIPLGTFLFAHATTAAALGNKSNLSTRSEDGKLASTKYIPHPSHAQSS
jgi:hypothetical protein